MAYVYLLFSDKTKKFYIGSTRDQAINKRLYYHNSGKNRSTKYGRPWKLIYVERLNNYTGARKRENFLKSGQGRKWIYEKFKNTKK